MFRLIFELLLMVVVLTVLKGILGIVMRGFSQVMKQPGSAAAGTSQGSSNQVPLTGELKKDPVCGTYIATTTSIKEKAGGEVLHFCSTECRDKYVASSVH